MLCLQPSEKWEKTAIDDPQLPGLYKPFLVGTAASQLFKSSGFQEILYKSVAGLSFKGYAAQSNSVDLQTPTQDT